MPWPAKSTVYAVLDRISTNLYQSEIITWLDIATSQAAMLSNEHTFMPLLNRQIALMLA